MKESSTSHCICLEHGTVDTTKYDSCPKCQIKGLEEQLVRQSRFIAVWCSKESETVSTEHVISHELFRYFIILSQELAYQNMFGYLKTTYLENLSIKIHAVLDKEIPQWKMMFKSQLFRQRSK